MALLILRLALAGLASLSVGNMETGREARRFTAASALAQQKIEDLRALGYDNSTSSGSTESLTEAGGTSGVTLLSRSWTVTGTPPSPKDVTVIVAWTGGLGSHEVRLQSKMAK